MVQPVISELSTLFIFILRIVLGDGVSFCFSVLQEVCQLLVHIKHPEVYQQLGVSPPRGFLLHGPPGCGKSLLAQAIAGVSTCRNIETEISI